MKKTGLLLLALAGFGAAAVGCTSTETAQAPESAQVTAEMAEPADQTGAVPQADASAQGGVAIQSAPAAEQPAVQQ